MSTSSPAPAAPVKRIDRYILAVTFGPLIACIAIAVSSLLLERLVRLLDLLVNKGSPLSLVFEMLVNLVPHYLGLALPAAYFIGVMLAISRLSTSSELDAMQSVGMGLPRLLAPIIALGVLLMITVTLLMGFLQPYTRYVYRALVYEATNMAWQGSIDAGTFFSGFDNLTIFVEKRTMGGQGLEGLFIVRTFDDRVETTTAARGTIERTADLTFMVLRVENGRRLVSYKNGSTPQAAAFDRLDFSLRLPEGVGPFRARGDDERELTYFELMQAMRDPPPNFNANALRGEFHARSVRIVTLLVLPFLAMPLGLASRRRSAGAGITMGLILLLLYHNVLQFGETTVDAGGSPYLFLWLPFGIFTLVSFWLFFAASRFVGYMPLDATLGALDAVGARLRGLVRRRLEPA
jgi:lipopolysaccharide export system permease protein